MMTSGNLATAATLCTAPLPLNGRRGAVGERACWHRNWCGLHSSSRSSCCGLTSSGKNPSCFVVEVGAFFDVILR